MAKKAILFGAGNIGRGFLAQLFSQSGYRIVFVDVKRDLIELLNEKKAYTLTIVGKRERDIYIKDIKAINGKDIQKISEEVIEANIMTTAVGARALKKVAPLIAEGIKKRADLGIEEPINVIIAENLLDAGPLLKSYLLEFIKPQYRDYLNSHLGLVQAVVRRRVPYLPEELRKKDPLRLLAEDYSILPVDKKGFIGEIPKIEGILPVDNIKALAEQKLFLHNGGYTVAAYLGYNKGYKYLHQAMQDKDIYNTTVGTLKEVGSALIKKYAFLSRGQDEYIQHLIRRFCDENLADSIEGLARDVIRKLSYNDRLIGAARLVLEFKIIPKNLIRGIVAALNYDEARDREARKLSREIKTKGIDIVLREICGLKPEDKLSQLIKKRMEKL